MRSAPQPRCYKDASHVPGRARSRTPPPQLSIPGEPRALSRHGSLAVRRGGHLLSSAGRGSRSCGRGGAGQGSALLTFPADHRSAVAGGRSARCQPTSGRAAACPAQREPGEEPPPPPPPLRPPPATLPAPGRFVASLPPPREPAAIGPVRSPAAGPLPAAEGPGPEMPPLPPPRRRFPTPALGGTDTPRIAALPRAGREELKRGRGKSSAELTAVRTVYLSADLLT